MAIVDDRPTLFIREQESNTNQDAEQVCKIYHGAFFSYRGVRFDVGLPNPNTPYDFAFNKTSTHRGITQNMRTAPQRGLGSQKTAPQFGATSWQHVQISTDSHPPESASSFSGRSCSPNISLLLHFSTPSSSARARLLATNSCAVKCS